jgi:translation initiation factor IF-2
MSENEQKSIELPNSLTVRELAERIENSPIDVIKQLMANGVMANINQQIDFDTAAIVVEEFGFEAHQIDLPELEASEDQAETPRWRQMIEDEDQASLVDRPAVVTFLGHVDHGKTSGISAYQVTHNDQVITFLDTPGHEAFTAMRARGAQGADIAVLVVAANDGVMPQTREALAHARAAKVPILVALNKIDRENANQARVMQELADVGLVPDEWDGDTMVVPVSAKEKTGLEDLLEAITLVADNAEILANPEGKVLGTVIEGEVDKARGIVSTLLIQNGTLRVGDALLAGTASGRARAMFDYQGQTIDEAPPSTPVSVLGLSDVPMAGEFFTVMESEREARAEAEKIKLEAKEIKTTQKVMSLDQIFEAFKAGEAQELKLVIKADVQGSLEPIISSLENLSAGDIRVNILHSATGNIIESDVMLASASDAIIIGFNVSADQGANLLAETERVDIRTYDIIYRLTEDVEMALKGMLEPETHETELGRAEVRAVFRIPKTGRIAGCIVSSGELHRNAKMRVLRAGEEIHQGPISSLRHEKDDVREIREGFECGVGLKGFEAFEVGDILLCFTEETVAVV